MKQYICPYCGYELNGNFEEFCPECYAVLSLSPYEMQKERIKLLINEAQTAITKNRWQLAQNDLMATLNLDPHNQEAKKLLKKTRRTEKLAKYYIQAQIHSYNKRWNKALDYYYRIQKIQPGYRDVESLIPTAKELQKEDKRLHSRQFQRNILRYMFIAGVILLGIALIILVIWGYIRTI